MLFQLSETNRHRHSIKFVTERFLILLVVISPRLDANKYKSLLPRSIEKYWNSKLSKPLKACCNLRSKPFIDELSKVFMS